MIKNRYLPSTALLSSALALSIATLSGCGGGKGATNTDVENTASQPHQLSARDIQNVDMFTTANPVANPTVTTDPLAKTLTITLAGTFQPDESNFQFFLNVDNDAKTGFRFDNEIWDEAGTDYIVENGNLFKSTANDTTWSWDHNVGDVIYSEDQNSVSVTIKQSLLNGLGPVIRAGFITRNLDWSVRSFYPKSSLMNEYVLDITPPVDTVPPELTLNGSSTIEIPLNSTFTDPGATATDNIDGDITDKITSSNTIDITKIGTYHVFYSVLDAAGNQAKATRIVKVIAENTTGIVIDGNNRDWTDIPVLAETDDGVLKVTDIEDSLYLLFVGKNTPLINTQFFLNTDYDASTGYIYNGSSWNMNGADYMVENNHLDKHKSNNASAWSWNYDVSPIDFVKNGFTIEAKIPKTALHNLGDNINVGFVNRDTKWHTEAVLPSDGMASYSLVSYPNQPTELVVLPFCNSLWETDGTIANTQVSPLNEYPDVEQLTQHNGSWYGVLYIKPAEPLNDGTDEYSSFILKYDGATVTEIARFDRVGNSPINISQLNFVADKQYFILDGTQLWSTEGGTQTHQIDGLGSVSEILATDDYLLAKETQDAGGGRVFVKTLHRVDQDDNVNEVPGLSTFSQFSYYPAKDNSVFIFSEGLTRKVDLASLSSELLPYTTEDFMRPIASVGDKLYFSIPEEISGYSLWVQGEGTEATKLSVFDTRPQKISTDQSLYISTSKLAPLGGRPLSISLWKVDSITDEIVLMKTLDWASYNSSIGFSSAWTLNSESYYTTYFNSGSGNSKALFKFGVEESILSGRSTPRVPGTLDTRPQTKANNESLYFSSYEDTNDATSRFIGIIDNLTGLPKKLSSCY